MFASLANVLGQWDNLPSPLPTDIKEHKLFDVETKYGLLQVRQWWRNKSTHSLITYLLVVFVSYSYEITFKIKFAGDDDTAKWVTRWPFGKSDHRCEMLLCVFLYSPSDFLDYSMGHCRSWGRSLVNMGMNQSFKCRTHIMPILYNALVNIYIHIYIFFTLNPWLILITPQCKQAVLDMTQTSDACRVMKKEKPIMSNI